MQTYIGLLRGINVGGHKKFPKAEQLEILDDLGIKNGQVYLHTGNWVFSSSETSEVLSSKISQAITEKYGWEVPVLVLKASAFETIFNSCPFKEDSKEKSYFTLLAEQPKAENVAKLKEYSFPNETYAVAHHCVYFYPALGAGKSKMNNNFFENKLKVTATSRNYNTMKKLVAISAD